MNKNELIELLKTSKEKEGQLRLKENEKRRKEIALQELEEEEYTIGMGPIYAEGSKGTAVNSKIENIVINKDEKIQELKKKIKQLEKEIELLKLDIEEVNVRLGCLSRLEKEILVDRFVNEMALEDIGTETYWKIRKQTRGRKAINKIIEKSLQKMEKI